MLDTGMGVYLFNLSLRRLCIILVFVYITSSSYMYAKTIDTGCSTMHLIKFN